MRVFTRGATITLTHTFYDSSGDVTSPTSASCTLAYPTSGFPFRGCYATTTVALTENTTTLIWSGTWNSRVSWPGTVFYSIVGDDTTETAKDDQFEIRGNRANLSVVSTT